jgi:hypothetical protein
VGVVGMIVVVRVVVRMVVRVGVRITSGGGRVGRGCGRGVKGLQPVLVDFDVDCGVGVEAAGVFGPDVFEREADATREPSEGQRVTASEGERASTKKVEQSEHTRRFQVASSPPRSPIKRLHHIMLHPKRPDLKSI